MVEILECDSCAEYFLDRIAYDEHLQSHDGGIICRLCGEHIPRLTIRDHLVSHIKEDQRRSVTDACFNKNQTSLRTHYLMKNNFKLQCLLCSETFCPRSNLQRHILMKHTNVNDKVYHSCHVCDTRFSLLQNLKRHLAIHEGITYACNACDRKYTRLADYKLHAKTHMGVQFKCPVCFKCVSRRPYLKKHMMKLHGLAFSEQEMSL